MNRNENDTGLQTAHSAPHLCVVGHPNKGKSSIVSTLAEDDSVRVGAESGTTRAADTFEFLLADQVALSLTDTPGFQRPRQVLAWLESEPVAPAERPERVRAFLAMAEHHQQFPDEVALLKPIMDGAGILYVVDASQAVTASDEAEMEILRWTGQPRMAVINPMAEAPAKTEWQRALSQFFQWVRVFNPLSASLPARLALLRAVGELTPDWHRPVTRLCQGLEAREQDRLQAVSEQLAHYWMQQLTQREPLNALDVRGLGQAELRLRDRLDHREHDLFEQLCQDWGHRSAQVVTVEQWELDTQNLMHTETWDLWGLKQRELLLVSGSAGAAAGLALDAGLGGASFLLGTVSGGVIGSAGGWWASKQLSGKRLGWLPLSREKQFAGPVQHPNFPLVVMARALTFTQQLWLRAHARRDAVVMKSEAGQWARQEQVQLMQWAKMLQRPLVSGLSATGRRWSPKTQQALVDWVYQTLASRIRAEYEQQQDAIWLMDEPRA